MRTDITGLRFIDEDHPENLVHAINSAYLSLCTSHQLGSVELADVTKIIALLLRCEADFLGKEKIHVSSAALRNGGVVLCMLGLGGKIRLWSGIEWKTLLQKFWSQNPNTFLEKLQGGFQVEEQKKKSNRTSSRSRKREKRAEL